MVEETAEKTLENTLENTLEQLYYELKSAFCIHRICLIPECLSDVDCGDFDTVGLVVDMRSAWSGRNKHRLDVVRVPFVQFESNSGLLFIFDTRLPKTPQQKAMERMTVFNRESDFRVRQPRTTEHDGTFRGAMFAQDLELAEELLEQYKYIIKPAKYVNENVIWFENVYDDRSGAYGWAISQSYHEYVVLLLEYGYKLPDSAMSHKIENIDGTEDDVKTVELILENGGGKQITRDMVDICIRNLAIAVHPDFVKNKSPEEVHHIVQNFTHIARRLNDAFHQKISDQLTKG